MKKFLTALSLLIGAAVLFMGLGRVWYVKNFKDYLNGGAFALELETLPVSKAGRIMPLSSAAADTLRLIGGKTSAKTADGKRISAPLWLWLLNAKGQDMYAAPVLRTDNLELQNLLGVSGRYFSAEALEKKHDEIYKAAVSAEASAYSRACDAALESAVAYGLASTSLGFSYADWTAQKTAEEWFNAVASARAELENAKRDNREADSAKLAEAGEHFKTFGQARAYENSYKNYLIRVIPTDDGAWLTPVEALLKKDLSPRERDILTLYAKVLADISNGDAAKLKDDSALLKSKVYEAAPTYVARAEFENFLNDMDPFFSGLILYALALLTLLISFITPPRTALALRSAALVFLFCGVAAQTFGVFGRIYIQNRPPVTNLYSSIVFAGWGAAAAGAFLSLKKRNALFPLASALSGFLSLIIALNLPHSGDTMGMMRAVLNSNFWLSVHVVTIMIGYCGVFLAGFLSAFRLIAYGVLRVNFSRENSEEFLKTIYGIVCFALLFSFAGTMLGGIWADLSWGRFWGWDPKENGALMIILWCAASIHMKLMHLCSTKTFLAMCVIGNIVAAWAWFGVNLLGVGLHSYGFFEGGWFWLCLFAVLQAGIAMLSFMPPPAKKDK